MDGGLKDLVTYLANLLIIPIYYCILKFTFISPSCDCII